MTSVTAPPPGSRVSTRNIRTIRKITLGALGVITFLAGWQLLTSFGILDPKFFPSATDTLARLGSETLDKEFWRNVGRTLTAWGIGLGASTVLAVTLGLIVGLIPALRRATRTTVEFLRPIPSVALIPLAVVSFGVNIEAALIIIVFACFWQIFVQTLYGVADIDTVARDTARSYALPRSETLRSLVLPTAMPYLMTGLRLAATVALILAVTAEMTIGNPGLGAQLMLAYSAGDREGMFAIVIMSGLLGLTINLIFGAIERRVLFWHQSVRGEDPQ